MEIILLIFLVRNQLVMKGEQYRHRETCVGEKTKKCFLTVSLSQ